jgi:hypothetical protein
VLAGGLYNVNELGGAEMLTIGRNDYLMMGKRSGYGTPTFRMNAGSSGTVDQYIQPISTRRTADQVADATARKLRTVTARNG